ncbi:MAG: hypothetical protein H0X13_08600 [Ramlibacter sp.]|nr:hypothetical protein [Ramlibacter sp.]
MRVPGKGDKLVCANGDVWLVLRCHTERGGPGIVAVDLIRQGDLTQTSRAVNLTLVELKDFCRKKGIMLPPA